MYIQLNVFNANDKCIATEEYEADTTYDFSTDLDKLIKRTKHGSYGKMYVNGVLEYDTRD